MDNNYNNKSSAQFNSFYQNYNEFLKCVKLMISNFKNQNQNEKNLNKIPIKILDIGCSHGKNSVAQMNIIIKEIIKELGENQVIHLYYMDVEMNDFTRLFLEIKNNQIKNNNIYSFSIGNTLENQLTSDNEMDFIFSVYTLQWSSIYKNYQKISNSFVVLDQTSRPDGYSDFCKTHFINVFEKRLFELKPGGIFICCFLIANNQKNILQNPDLISEEQVFANFKSILIEMVNESLISNKEVENIIVPFLFINKEEIDFVNQKLNQKGLMLLNCHEEFDKSWKNNHDNNQLDQYNFAEVESLLSVVSSIIKNSINGDSERKNSIYQNFKNRVFNKYTINPKLFDFYFTVIHCSFQKISNN